jgi:hypothetical protein
MSACVTSRFAAAGLGADAAALFGTGLFRTAVDETGFDTVFGTGVFRTGVDATRFDDEAFDGDFFDEGELTGFLAIQHLP